MPCPPPSLHLQNSAKTFPKNPKTQTFKPFLTLTSLQRHPLPSFFSYITQNPRPPFHCSITPRKPIQNPSFSPKIKTLNFNPTPKSFLFRGVSLRITPSSIPRFQFPPISQNPAMIFFKFLLLFPLLTLAFSHESPNSHHLPRPLIIEYPDHHAEPNFKELDEEVKLRCTSWRFAVEANNVNPWKTIPEECVEYVKDYVTGRGYGVDLERVSNEAGVYAKSVVLGGDGKDVWIFDVDDTLLSNVPYYADHGYGSEVFDQVEFDKWVDKGMSPAVKSSLKLYEEVLGLGFKVFLLTGRSEGKRGVTAENLKNVGFQDWHKLILRAADDHGKSATIYKSEKRSEMEKEGYRILGNSGDQWSDLLGSSMSIRSFKIPNPMYYIP